MDALSIYSIFQVDEVRNRGGTSPWRRSPHTPLYLIDDPLYLYSDSLEIETMQYLYKLFSHSHATSSADLKSNSWLTILAATTGSLVVTMTVHTDAAQAVSFTFDYLGGNLNLSVNGNFVNFPNFAAINGTVVGGARVSVISFPIAGGSSGTVDLSPLTGSITDLVVGGQELFIDNVTFPGGVLTFGTTPPGVYRVGSRFVASGVPITVRPFTFATGVPTSSGTVTVGTFPGTSITGQSLSTNNANVQLALPAIPTPALLPGLIGMGIATIRKRQEQRLTEVS